MSEKVLLSIKNLRTEIEGRQILSGVDLDVPKGQVHAIMGPNGSGKSSLALTIMGHPRYAVTAGSVHFKKTDILPMSVDERAKMGLFLGFQYPLAIPGVSVGNFLRLAAQAQGKTGDKSNFRKDLYSRLEQLGLDKQFAARNVNDGFSGGEKKRFEIVQMHTLQPDLAILDEIDSGLDIDALKTVAASINEFSKTGRSILLITHYHRILEFIKPDAIHIMVGGKIVKSGDSTMSTYLEKHGYAEFEAKND